MQLSLVCSKFVYTSYLFLAGLMRCLIFTKTQTFLVLGTLHDQRQLLRLVWFVNESVLEITHLSLISQNMLRMTQAVVLFSTFIGHITCSTPIEYPYKLHKHMEDVHNFVLYLRISQIQHVYAASHHAILLRPTFLNMVKIYFINQLSAADCLVYDHVISGCMVSVIWLCCWMIIYTVTELVVIAL